MGMAGRTLWGALFFVLAACGSGGGSPSNSAGHGGSGSGAGGTDAGASGASVSGASAQGGTAMPIGGGDAGGKENGGNAGNAGSGGGATATRCTADQPFGTPHLFEELNEGGHNAGARLTSDELNIVYFCLMTSPTVVGRICLAHRSTRTETFQAPRVIVAKDGGVPWISDDLLTLFFEDTGVNYGVFFTQRMAADAPFPGAGPFKAPFDNAGDPYVVGGKNGHLYTSINDAVMVSSLEDWVPSEPAPVPMAKSAPFARPTPTPDELTIYLARRPSGAAAVHKMEAWVGTRASVGAPFNVAPVTELNTHVSTFPSWISPDGCRLYYDAGDSELGNELYVAERH